LLYSGAAGQWPNAGGNANIVPLVANGRAYVGAYKTLTIFGAGGTLAHAEPIDNAEQALPSGTSRVSGTLVSLQGYALTLLTRSGTRVEVDATRAAANERSTLLVIGDAYTVIAPAGTTPLRATSITRAKPGVGAWPPDQSP
jgi:hypothetical protein